MIPMLTYQDFQQAQAAGDTLAFISKAIQQHMMSREYLMARDADEYDRQRNVTVNNYTKFIAEHSGSELVNATAANNRIASNFFRRLNTQRATYSLGNGVSFTYHKRKERDRVTGAETEIDETKERLGKNFDRDFYKLAYKALIHRECFGYWNVDRLYVFPLTEFVPMYDENTSALRAGIRFWRVADGKPTTAVLYTEQGFTKYRTKDGYGYQFEEIEPLRAYIERGYATKAEGFEVTGYDNYSTLPIIRMKGSDLYQSTLVGMRQHIDSYDLIQSGFANDLQDCAQIYWIIENCGGMNETDLREFLNRLNRDHIVTADTRGMGVESSSLKPYVQDVPFESRVAYLEHIRGAIYEAFGGLDVTNMSSTARTATEIESAYQPLDENADDFEYQCEEAIMQLLAILGIEDTPTFKRNRIYNQAEQTEMIMSAANYLDTRTILNKLPFLTVDEIEPILAAKDAESTAGLEDMQTLQDEMDEHEQEA